MQFMFLDTNIFIHFVDFEQIDWKKISGSTDEVVLMIAPIVLEELDRHKYNKNKRIAQKVKKLLPKLENAISDQSSYKYEVRLLINRPKDALFLENSLDKSVQDDHLLASFIEFRQQLAETDKAFFITHDVGPRLKAKSLSIDVIPMDDKYLLPNEPDEFEIENKALQKELSALRHRAPKVAFTFFDQSVLKTYRRNKLPDSKDAFIENELKFVQADYPYLTYQSVNEHITNNPLSGLFSSPLFAIPQSEIDDYNRDLDVFFKKYEDYAEDLYEEGVFKNNAIKIEFRIGNSGTAPAEDIDVDIHFPDGFDLLMESDFPKRKTKPNPPSKPNRGIGNFRMPLSPTSFYQSANFQPNDTSVKFDLPRIKKTNSYNVNYHFKSLKHNQSLELEPLYAIFSDMSRARGFKIEYKLIISNLPHPVSGTLNINFSD